MTYPKGIEAQIYGWDTLASNPEKIIICEGEMDRLALLSQNIPPSPQLTARRHSRKIG